MGLDADPMSASPLADGGRVEVGAAVALYRAVRMLATDCLRSRHPYSFEYFQIFSEQRSLRMLEDIAYPTVGNRGVNRYRV